MRDMNRTETEAYETPALTEYGTIEEWTQGVRAALIDISIVI
jgi:hypothetical protein